MQGKLAAAQSLLQQARCCCTPRLPRAPSMAQNWEESTGTSVGTHPPACRLSPPQHRFTQLPRTPQWAPSGAPAHPTPGSPRFPSPAASSPGRASCRPVAARRGQAPGLAPCPAKQRAAICSCWQRGRSWGRVPAPPSPRRVAAGQGQPPALTEEPQGLSTTLAASPATEDACQRFAHAAAAAQRPGTQREQGVTPRSPRSPRSSRRPKTTQPVAAPTWVWLHKPGSAPSASPSARRRGSGPAAPAESRGPPALLELGDPREPLPVCSEALWEQAGRYLWPHGQGGVGAGQGLAAGRLRPHLTPWEQAVWEGRGQTATGSWVRWL